MGRRRGEAMTCPSCAWQGVSARARVRLGVLALTLVGVAGLFGAAAAGWISFGDASAWSITSCLFSLAIRVVLHGDRCRACGHFERP